MFIFVIEDLTLSKQISNSVQKRIIWSRKQTQKKNKYSLTSKKRIQPAAKFLSIKILFRILALWCDHWIWPFFDSHRVASALLGCYSRILLNFRLGPPVTLTVHNIVNILNVCNFLGKMKIVKITKLNECTCKRNFY